MSESKGEKRYGLLAVVRGKTGLSDKELEDYVPTFPYALILQVNVALVIIIALHFVAILFNAPLEEIANPDLTPLPAKAPWFFLALQEILHYSPPVVAGVMVPGLLILGLILLPFFRREFVLVPLSILLSALIVPLFDSLFWKSDGLVSIVGTILAVGGVTYWVLRNGKRLADTPLLELLRRLGFTAFLLVLLILTIIGTYFRGAEWKWVWPWMN